MLVFCIFDITLNAFSNANSLSQIFTNWNFKFKEPTFEMFMTGLAPGITEEFLMRYTLLSILLISFKNNKYQFVFSVYLSALIFGAMHLPNMLAQNLSATIEQAISAAAAGCLLATLYLYTNSLLWPILYHVGIDSLSMMASGSTLMSRTDTFDWQLTILTGIIYILISIFLLTGKRKKVIARNFTEFIS